MAADEFEIVGGGDFAPVAILANPISYFDTRISISNLVMNSGDNLYVGLAAMVDEEIVVVTAVGPGYVDVARGCSDTIPAPHPAGSVIWFYPDNVGIELREYSAGETITVKPLPWLYTGEVLPLEESPPLELTMNYRFSRPYPPGQMESNGTPWFQVVNLSADNPHMVLTWAHRDRILQSDRQIDHFHGDIGPEPGTTYIARIFNKFGDLKRTEVGIVGTTWTYTWGQALNDMGLSTVPAGDSGATTSEGYMEFTSFRDGLEGWQFYTLPFTVNNEAPFIQLAQLSEIVAQPDPGEDGDGELRKASGMFVTQVSELALTEEPIEPDGDWPGLPPASGLFVTRPFEQVTQLTSLYTWMNRGLFEAPYTFLLRKIGNAPASGRVVTVLARPSDRLTDSHKIWSREVAESGMLENPFELRDDPPFTPWVTIDDRLDYLTNVVTIRETSFFDGVSLDDVRPGQMALINAEVVCIVAKGTETLTIARGCADTVPATHQAGSRMWFFEAASGFDRTGFTLPPVSRPAGVCGPNPGWVYLEYKMVPDVYGPPLELSEVPTDKLTMMLRNQRPFPPGQVRVNGRHWFEGWKASPDQNAVITWVQRNRITQGADLVDHTAPNIPHEDGTTYRIKIEIAYYASRYARCPTRVVIREEYVTGNRFEYTYEMALADGHRVAGVLTRAYGRLVCGSVTVPLRLDAMRNGLDNWQGYNIMVSLPAPRCPIRRGQPIGGPGGIGAGPGRGNGDVGYDPGDGSGGWPTPGGPDGSGPKPGEPLPPDWPDPVLPPIEEPDENPEPAPEPPEGVGYWDFRWDTFWASRGNSYFPGDGDYDPGDGAEDPPAEDTEE